MTTPSDKAVRLVGELREACMSDHLSADYPKAVREACARLLAYIAELERAAQGEKP